MESLGLTISTHTRGEERAVVIVGGAESRNDATVTALMLNQSGVVRRKIVENGGTTRKMDVGDTAIPTWRAFQEAPIVPLPERGRTLKTGKGRSSSVS